LFTDPSGELAAVPASGGAASILISNAALAAAWGPCPDTRCDLSAVNPAFSPDGSTIAFDLDGYGWQSLHVANSDGSNPRQLFVAGTPPNVNVGGAPAGPPRWSADGSQIAYGEVRKPCGYTAVVCDAGGHPCPPKGPCANTAIIRVVVSDGTAEQLTSPQEPDLENPAWSPNGHWLAFNLGGVGGGIWRVQADGSCLERLAGAIGHTRDAGSDPVWRPGGGSPTDACS
jgi:Tol biopolymer transport system component